MLDGDRRHQRLGSVAARHPETIRSSRDCAARQVGELDAVVEHHRLDPECVRKFDETEFVDLPATRPRVAQQDRVLRRWHVAHDRRGCRVQVGPQRCLRRQHGDGEQEQRQHQPQHGRPVLLAGPQQRKDLEGRSDDCDDHAEEAAGHALCDSPPAAGDGAGQTHDAKDEIRAVAEQGGKHQHDECRTGGE